MKLKYNCMEKFKLLLEVMTLTAVLLGGAVWTLSWSGKSPEMKITLSASKVENAIVLMSDIEVARVDFKVLKVAIKVGDHYNIWQGKDNSQLSLKERLTDASQFISSAGNLGGGSCDQAAAQILNKSGVMTVGDKRTVQCHIELEKDSEHGCIPVILRLVGKRALPFDLPWAEGEFFAMAVACTTDKKLKERK